MTFFQNYREVLSRTYRVVQVLVSNNLLPSWPGGQGHRARNLFLLHAVVGVLHSIFSVGVTYIFNNFQHVTCPMHRAKSYIFLEIYTIWPAAAGQIIYIHEFRGLYTPI